MPPKHTIEWHAGPLDLTIEVDNSDHLWLRSIRTAGSKLVQPRDGHESALPLTEIRLAGEGGEKSTSQRGVGTYLGRRLCYVAHNERTLGDRALLDVESHDENTGASVINHFCVWSGQPVVRATVEVRNDSAEDFTLQMVSSLVIGGLSHDSKTWAEDFKISYAFNSWFREAQWQKMSMPDVGLDNFLVAEEGHDSTRACFAVSNQGSFSTGGNLPMGALENKDSTQSMMWQLENNGSWRWEIGDFEENVYMLATGPTDANHNWSKRISPKETFTSIPVALAVVDGPREEAFGAITKYRRAMRRKHKDNETLPVIFNDYMNCLMGDPTTEKVLALIEPASKAGAEYFVIDAGWYADDSGWWDTVGEWEESKSRFPEGLDFVLGKIKEAGMTPGLWIEPEVMGIKCPAQDQLPPEAYFQRNGRRVIEQGRFQLDFRCEAVIQRMDAIIDRLVNEYGAGYFKFDYNICVTQGTDVHANSPGDGALDHNRAYLAWVNHIFDRFPDLVIESCSSGAQRMEYAQLGTHPIQSTSDQQDPIAYAAIAASVPTAVTPEQSASWAYPQPKWDDELIAFTVVNSLLGRVHLSGRLDELSTEQHQLVADGMSVYKDIRDDLRHALPFWPLGLPRWSDRCVALGMKTENVMYVALWCRKDETACRLPIPGLGDKDAQAHCLYPTSMSGATSCHMDGDELVVKLPKAPAARLFKIT